MKNVDITRFSDFYKVRRLTAADVEDIHWIMKFQERYYAHSGKERSIEAILRDMEALPPGKSAEDKYYVGYFEDDCLMAVLDFIDGWPDADTAYIGFFMLDHLWQGKGNGVSLMEKLCIYCAELGYKRVMLGWDKGNHQSGSFWRKMGFEPVKEVEQEHGIIVVAERVLPEPKKEKCFADFVLEQAKLHPSMQPRDALKMCYQAAHGAEHAMSDPAGARKYLREELKAVAADAGAPIYEQISPELCRVNLGAWKFHNMKWQWLFNMFTASGGSGDIEPLLETVRSLAERGMLPFTGADWDAELASWNGGAVSHSEGYRAAEKPHYRIVPMRYASALLVLQKMAQYPEGCVVAIDGRSNSGKSTLGSMLAEITEGGLIRMDDLLSPASRGQVVSKGWPGGNVNYAMFREHILPNLSSEKAFSYPYFANHSLVINRKRRVRRSIYRIVEGSYSQHVVFGDYMDIRVFMTTPVTEQRRRVLARDGERLAPSYFHIWIPQEEEYFSFFKLWEKADVLIET